LVIWLSGGVCEVCRKRQPAERLEVHHILKVREGGTDDAWNLQVLCKKHHRRLNGRYLIGYGRLEELSA